MSKPSCPTLLKEIKDKYVELTEGEDNLEELFLLDDERNSKFPRRVKEGPKTIHYQESACIISDTQI